jgi:hypothetical protein
MTMIMMMMMMMMCEQNVSDVSNLLGTSTIQRLPLGGKQDGRGN